MAGDWIKIEENTPDKPEVQKIASMLDLDPDAVTGKLIRVWAWASQNCNAQGVTDVTVKALLDRITCVTGFAQSMLQVGWLQENGDDLSFPNFDYHNSQTAKTRAKSNKRVAEHREMKRKCNAKSVTEPLPKALPEKRREEIKSTLSARAREEPEDEIQEYQRAGPDDPGSVVYPPCTKTDVDLFAGLSGIPDDVARSWYEKHEAEDWRPYGGNPPFTTKSWKWDLKNYWKIKQAKQHEQQHRNNGASAPGKAAENPRNSHLPDSHREESARVAEMEDVRDALRNFIQYPKNEPEIITERLFESEAFPRAIEFLKRRRDGLYEGIYDRLAEQGLVDVESWRKFARDRGPGAGLE